MTPRSWWNRSRDDAPDRMLDHTPGKGRRGKLATNLVRLAIGTALGFVLAEAGSRVYLSLPSDPRTANYLPDPDAGYRIRPDRPEEILDPDDHFTALGVRGREHSQTKPEGVFRVLGIGDSFVFGSVPMADNFLRVAERGSNESLVKLHPEIEVIPLGVPGYSPENYVGILRSVGLDLDPDLVLMFFYVGNDITGIPVRGRVFRGELYYVGSSSPWLALLRSSRFFMLVETFALRTLKKLNDSGAEVSGGGSPTEGRQPESAPLVGAQRAQEPWVDDDDESPSLPYLLFQARRLPVYAAEPDRRIERLWSQAEEYLRDFDRTCRAAEVPWTLVAVPSEIQVDEEIRGKVLDALSHSGSDYDFSAPQKRLSHFCRESGIEILDLLPILRAAWDGGPDSTSRRDEVGGETGRLYIPNNTHWSVRGNWIVGSTLADVLRSRAGHPQPPGSSGREFLPGR